LLFLALLVFDLQRELAALDAAGFVDLVERQLKAVADRLAVLARGAGKRLGGAELDVGGVHRTCGAGCHQGGDQRARAERCGNGHVGLSRTG